jgi:ABC-type Fe3+ transport system permease subunit
VYTTWISRSDLSAAAQIACMMLMFIFLILTLEFYGRRKQGFSSRSLREIQPTRVQGWRGWLLGGVISLPVVLGFLAPVLFLMWESAKRIGDENPFLFVTVSITKYAIAGSGNHAGGGLRQYVGGLERAIAPQTTPCRDFVAA